MKAAKYLFILALTALFGFGNLRSAQAQDVQPWNVKKFSANKKKAKLVLENVSSDTLELNAAGMDASKSWYVPKDVRIQHDTLVVNLDVQSMDRETYEEEGRKVTYSYDMYLLILPGKKVKMNIPLEGKNTDGNFSYLIVILENGETIEAKL